jgi:hypothetical protein
MSIELSVDFKYHSFTTKGLQGMSVESSFGSVTVEGHEYKGYQIQVRAPALHKVKFSKTLKFGKDLQYQR